MLEARTFKSLCECLFVSYPPPFPPPSLIVECFYSNAVFTYDNFRVWRVFLAGTGDTIGYCMLPVRIN